MFKIKQISMVTLLVSALLASGTQNIIASSQQYSQGQYSDSQSESNSEVDRFPHDMKLSDEHIPEDTVDQEEQETIYDGGDASEVQPGYCSRNDNVDCVDDYGCVGTCSGGKCDNDPSLLCTDDMDCDFGTCDVVGYVEESERHLR
jgi:hypothetical protein